MKKTILGILMIAILAIAMMAGNVNAASVVVDPATTSKITAGQQVKVTVTADGRGASYQVAYDTSKFTFELDETKKDTSITSINTDYHGTGNLYVVALSTTQTLIFTAKEDIDTNTTLPFTIKDLSSVGADDVASMQTTVTVTPASPTPTPEGGEGSEEGEDSGEGSEEGEGASSETEKGSDSKGKYVDENGKEITEIPQAGTTYFVGAAIVLVALLSGALAVRKIRK